MPTAATAAAAAATLDLSALELSVWDILLRLMCAMLIGAMIGTEREFTHRPAGMRTHMLVAVGACAVMITSQLIFWQYRAYGATPDPARLSAQVITGIGFLGAGTIMKEGPTIKGLTTAASIWAVACLGVAVGGGYYAVGLVGAGCMMVTLVIFEKLQNLLMKNHYALYTYSVTCEDIVYTLDLIHRLAVAADATVTSTEVEQDEGKGTFHICFKANFGGRAAGERMQKFFSDLASDPHTISVTQDRTRM